MKILDVLVLSAAFAAPFVELPGSATASPAVHRIVIEKMAFGPQPVAIHTGDTVEWVNHDIFRHSVTADDKSFDIDIEPNATASIVVRKAGLITYICKYHPSMKGTLAVEK